MGYEISKEIEFDAGHRVPNHYSKCSNPHGHRYRVVAHLAGELVTTPGVSSEGMLEDFSHVKTALTELIHDPLDHGFIIYEGDYKLRDMFKVIHDEANNQYDNATGFKVIVVPFVPTAENLAKWFYDLLAEKIDTDNLYVLAIDLWETPTSCATYRVD